MNEKDKIRRLKRVSDYTNIEERRGVRVHGDAFRHFVVKAALFKVLQEAGHEVRTEVEFGNGRIADVLDLETCLVYEVETDKSRLREARKVGNFWDYSEIQDVLVLDPLDAPSGLEGLEEWVREHAVL